MTGCVNAAPGMFIERSERAAGSGDGQHQIGLTRVSCPGIPHTATVLTSAARHFELWQKGNTGWHQQHRSI